MNEIIYLYIAQFARTNLWLDNLAVLIATLALYFVPLALVIRIFAEKSWRRRWLFAAELILAGILSRGIVTPAIRFFYEHPRPFVLYGTEPLLNETSNSFPSGHAAFLFALAMTAWFYNRRWGNWLFAVASLVGLARIFAGVHWPFDVLGGAAVGILSAWLIHRLLKTDLNSAPPAETTENSAPLAAAGQSQEQGS